MRSSRRPACGGRSRRRSSVPRPETWTRSPPPRRRSGRRCASRPSRTRCGPRSRSATASSHGPVGDEQPPVAVRSSALGEDSEEASHAGQQESFLWVRGLEHVCDAVRDCWVSLYTPQAISYRAALGGRRVGAGDGRHRPADGRRRGLGRAVHVQPRERRPEHGRGERELGPRDRGRRRRGDAGRLPREQGHRRGRAPDRELEAGRVRPRRGGSRNGAAGGARTSDGKRPVSTRRSSPRSSRSPAGWSATSGPIRTWSGRSRAEARCRRRCTCSRHVP